MLHLQKVCNKSEASMEGILNVKYSLVFPTLCVLNIFSAEPLCMPGIFPPSPKWCYSDSDGGEVAMATLWCSLLFIRWSDQLWGQTAELWLSHGSTLSPAWCHEHYLQTGQRSKPGSVPLLSLQSPCLRDDCLTSLMSGRQQRTLATPNGRLVPWKGNGTMGWEIMARAILQESRQEEMAALSVWEQWSLGLNTNSLCSSGWLQTV